MPWTAAVDGATGRQIGPPPELALPGIVLALAVAVVVARLELRLD